MSTSKNDMINFLEIIHIAVQGILKCITTIDLLKLNNDVTFGDNVSQINNYYDVSYAWCFPPPALLEHFLIKLENQTGLSINIENGTYWVEEAQKAATN